MARPLSVLFVRPADRSGLHMGLRFAVARESSEELPVPLLRLASAVLHGSSHRVFVHDARRPPGRTGGSLRTAAAVHKPDVSVVWLHPALLADGLEAARTVRHSGSPLVIGTGPLVDLWPSGAGRLPELDGLLPSFGHAGLLLALERVAARDGESGLAEALGLPPGPPPFGFEPTVRKLLDYAVYRAVEPRWPGHGGRARGPDKGRLASSAVLLHDEAGTPLPPPLVQREMHSCDLLGIPNLALVPGPGAPPLGAAQWDGLLHALAGAGSARKGRHLRLSMSPQVARSREAEDLAALGVDALHLGDVAAGDDGAVRDLVAAGRAAQRAGLRVTATMLLGLSGHPIEREAAGIDEAAEAGVEADVAVFVQVGSVDPAAWDRHLESPGGGFVPPGVDPRRLAMATGSAAARGEELGERRGVLARLAARVR